MIKLGGGLLEGLLGLDSGYGGARVGCPAGHPAKFSDYRAKTIDTILGPVRLRRDYAPCAECSHGLVPRDGELGVAGESLSVGLRRMVDRVGSREPLAQGSRDLAELAGLKMTSKRAERSPGRSCAAAPPAVIERQDEAKPVD